MRRLLLVVLTLALSWSSQALGCGDKFLLIGRGAGYRGRYVAIHPASILLLGANAAGNGDVDVRRILQRAGHRVDYQSDPTKLDAAVKAKPYDFVIVALDRVSQTQSRVQSLAPGALVVPIIFASNDQEVKQVEKQYECIAHSEDKQRNFLAVLDDAMSMHLKGTPMHCAWAAK
jgi:protein-L-isoaspartate O-methyltransferase